MNFLTPFRSLLHFLSVMGDDGPVWCQIESDPAIFSQILRDLGVKGVQVVDLYALDEDMIQSMGGDVYGLIFLFKWDRQKGNSPSHPSSHIPKDLFFARQVVHNACGTMAILNMVMNLPQMHKSVDLGPLLSDIQSFTLDFPSEEKGMVIGQHEKLREVHDSFARPLILEMLGE